MTTNKKATIISTAVAFVLTILKLFVGIASGSVAVLASAIDSVLDMLVSMFNYFAISNSEKPADDKFNYGKGKIEALASVIEGTIIATSGLFLLYSAVKKYFLSETTKYLDVSLVVMSVSFVITILLVIYLNKVAKKTNSMVIKADALHYKTDVYVNGSVMVSLLLVWITNIELIDIVVGIGIAIFIIYSAYELISDGVLMLLDRAVDDEIVKKIVSLIENDKTITSYHFLKTRLSALDIFVDVHLVFDTQISLLEAHKCSDNIELLIEQIDDKYNWTISAHLDPYDDSIEHDCETISTL